MCADELRVAFVIPKVDAFSGGIERSLKLLEYSDRADIRYTVFLPSEGVPNAEVEAQVAALERAGRIEIRRLSVRQGDLGEVYDVTVIPTEYWWGAWKRARAGGLRAPYCLDFMQLPYIGTLDILKAVRIDEPSLRNLGIVPFLQAKVYSEGLVNSAYQTLASIVSVRWSSRIRDARVLALTAVVEKNLDAIGYRGQAFVPSCPAGIDRTMLADPARTDQPFEYDAIYVGRFHPQKGFLDLPLVVAHLKELLRREVKIAVCGGSDTPGHMARFQASVRALGIERNLTILGRIPKANLYQMIRRSKILLYPSYVDAFSITVLESLCLGVPVAAYNIDAMRMIWSLRKAVFCAPVGDPRALAELAATLVTDPGLGEAREAAQAQSGSLPDEYTWQKVVAEERRFYDSAISGAGSTS